MTAMGKLVCRCLLLGLPLLALNRAISQDQRPQSPAKQAAARTVHGGVKSGSMPIPGAAVSISPSSSDLKFSAWTDVDGSYSVPVPSDGSYTGRIQMVAFANNTQNIVIDASHQDVLANFDLTLLSRTREATPPPGRPNRPGGAQRGSQTLSAMQNMATQDSSGTSMSDVVPSGMPVPGIDPNSATESIAVSGNSSSALNSMSGDELQQRINDARQQGGGFGGPGTSAYSGQSTINALNSNFTTQETLVTLASDTGGRAFLDSNDFTQVFRGVQQDTSTYYLLGYRSDNAARDGRYRRISVKVNVPGVKVDYRRGYYAPADYRHSTKEDKELQLQEELASQLPTTDLPLYLSTAYFRLEVEQVLHSNLAGGTGLGNPLHAQW